MHREITGQDIAKLTSKLDLESLSGVKLSFLKAEPGAWFLLQNTTESRKTKSASRIQKRLMHVRRKPSAEGAVSSMWCDVANVQHVLVHAVVGAAVPP